MFVASGSRAVTFRNYQFVQSVRRRGSAFVFSLILMIVLVTVSTSLLMSSTVGVINADNAADIHQARFLAEGGVNYMRFHLQGMDIPADVDADGLLTALALELQSEMGNSLITGTITQSGNDVLIPDIRPQNGDGTFSALLHFENDDPSTNIIRLRVTGSVTGGDGVTIDRTIETAFTFTPGSQGGSQYNFADSIFAWGVAVNGPIWMSGNARIWSTGDWNEVVGFYSGYTGDQNIVDIQGSSKIEGPGATPATEITGAFGGGSEINGVPIQWKAEYNWGPNIPELLAQITTGVEPPEFPQVNQEMFEQFVPPDGQGITSTPTVQYWPQFIDTYTNLRVEAGTNPTFGANIKITGILYVEAPNRVEFASNSQMTGIIVTEDAEGINGTSQIIFSNDADLYSVDSLPNESQYEAIKQIRNSAILAPGFDIRITNGSTSVGGTMIGRKLTIDGNGQATVSGAVVMTGDDPMDLRNSGRILVDLSDLSESNETPGGTYFETDGGGEEVAGTLTMNSGYWKEY